MTDCNNIEGRMIAFNRNIEEMAVSEDRVNLLSNVYLLQNTSTLLNEKLNIKKKIGLYAVNTFFKDERIYHEISKRNSDIVDKFEGFYDIYI